MEKSTETALGRVLADRRLVAEAAEEILWNLDGELPSADQRDILRMVGIATSQDLEGAISRVEHIKSQLALVPAPAKVLEAEKDAIATERTFRESSPDLQEKIAKLQSELATITSDRDAAQLKLSNYSKAKEAVRQLHTLPLFVREAYEAEVRRVQRSTNAQRISAIKHDIGIIDALQKMSPSSQEALLHCQAVATQCVVTQNAGGMTTHKVDERAFIAFCKRRLEARAALARELDELEEVFNSELAKQERLRDYYLDRI